MLKTMSILVFVVVVVLMF